MIDLKVSVTKRPNFRKIESNFRFGVATGMTKTVKEAQDSVLQELPRPFTLRGTWFKPRNKFGIKIKAARKNDLVAEVRTRADWLELHEKGGTKRPKGDSLAIPTKNVRRLKSRKIGKAQRPRNLKRKFVLNTKRGRVLFVRKYRGKRSHIVAMYNLEKSARIRKQSTFYEPAIRTVKKKLSRNIDRGLLRAFRTMK